MPQAIGTTIFVQYFVPRAMRPTIFVEDFVAQAMQTTIFVEQFVFSRPAEPTKVSSNHNISRESWPLALANVDFSRAPSVFRRHPARANVVKPLNFSRKLAVRACKCWFFPSARPTRGQKHYKTRAGNPPTPAETYAGLRSQRDRQH